MKTTAQRHFFLISKRQSYAVKKRKLEHNGAFTIVSSSDLVGVDGYETRNVDAKN